MKKSVVILIALIYVASIVLVGYLGLKAKTYNDVIYVEMLEITTEYETSPTTGEKYIVFLPESADERSIQIQAKLTPEDASDTKIIYTLEKDCTTATISEDGLLTFTTTELYTSVKVYIYANQNTSIKDEVTVYYYNEN